jgi:hypothetical protein
MYESWAVQDVVPVVVALSKRDKQSGCLHDTKRTLQHMIWVRIVVVSTAAAHSYKLRSI